MLAEQVMVIMQFYGHYGMRNPFCQFLVVMSRPLPISKSRVKMDIMVMKAYITPNNPAWNLQR